MTISIVLSFFFGVLAYFSGVATIACVLSVIGGLLAYVGFPRHRLYYLKVILAFLFGIGFSAFRVHLDNHHHYPRADEQQWVTVRGVVSSLPYRDSFGAHFTLSVNQSPMQGKLLLIARAGEFRAGEGVQCKVRLNRVHGTENPGGMDSEAMAFANHLIANGAASDCQPTGEQRFSLRGWMADRLRPCLPHTKKAAWLMALLLGERVNMDPQDWVVLRNTGTNHLMAIGGLHLGMLALWVSVLVGWLWRPHPVVQAVASVLVCFIYACLSGFSIPTERAFVMLCVFVMALVLRRKCLAWQPLGLALGLVLLMNPAMVLLQGFWFSFLAIAWIGVAQQGRPYLPRSRIRQAQRLQTFITLGLLPLSLYFFQSYEGLSLLANAIAIPWLGVFILPFCLLALLFVPWFPWMAAHCLQVAGFALDGLWTVLSTLSHWPLLTLHVAAPSLLAVVVGSLGILILLLPRSLPGKPLAWLCVLPMVMTHSYALPRSHYSVAVLDVGQGLSLVVRTRNHVLVYDAGGRLTPASDEGERVVLPYLASQGITRLDTLVVSHGDNDHAGGASALIRVLPIQHFLTSVPQQFPKASAEPCVAGMAWQWDGVHFAMLAPKSDTLQGNNASCVLMIDNGRVRTLLPGDSEADAENALLASQGARLSADLLIAPHHGSDTSSTPAFRAAVHPAVVVYSTGYHNHYHLPSASVVTAYAKQGAQAFNTVNEGALMFEAGDALHLVHRERANKKVWQA